jgi:hypothetical protein
MSDFLEVHHHEEIDLVVKENVNDELHQILPLNNNENAVHKHHHRHIGLKNGTHSF